jgi:hypothetical protein
MKKIFTILVLILMSISTFGQIKKIESPKTVVIGKIAPLGSLVASIEKTEDNTYIFTYRDVNKSPLDVYKSFYFKETGHDFESLYQMIINGFEEIPKEALIVEVPNGKLYISFDKSMGVVNATISSETETELLGYCRALTKRDVNKLFGKK